ncbi:hypothetical protein CMUS01_02692 [Colletotrichum musicola]|uniref:Uncharacterized protein n=1 Tax=Colletotrichum musicola TaxID=2175873 RepID=A0A8H6NUK1_9PEZI|nr:hypothetical protein CMUS01_02692 [Colletotrichum musicola]
MTCLASLHYRLLPSPSHNGVILAERASRAGSYWSEEDSQVLWTTVARFHRRDICWGWEISDARNAQHE